MAGVIIGIAAGGGVVLLVIVGAIIYVLMKPKGKVSPAGGKSTSSSA